MITTRVFKSGNSQAIRIPCEMKTDKDDYYISKVGEAYVLYPVNDPWFPLRQTVGRFPDEFMTDREQPIIQDDREEL